MPLWALLARGSFLAAPGHCGRAPGPPPRTPGWLEGLRALWLPHLSKGWQGTEGLRAHRVPFPTPQRLQKRTVLDSTPKPPSWVWNAVSPHPQPSKPAAPPVAESYPPRPGRGDGRGMCGTPRPGLSALRSALPSVPWSLSHRVPEPGASGSLSEVARTRSLLPRGGPRGAEQGAASPGVRHDRRSPHCPRRPAPRPRRLRATPLEAPPCRWRPMHRGRRPQVRAESAARRLAEGSETLRPAAAGPGSYL